MHRVNGECEFCPDGYYSSDGTACLECSGDNVAEKVLSISHFRTWPSFLSTRCSGDCATEGWRLREDSIDTGIGHGKDVQVVLEITVTVFFLV